MAAEVQGPRSKVRVWRDDSDERGPRYWVQVQRPGRDVPEEYSYRQLMGTPANIEEDRLIKQEVQRQQRALEKEWREKAATAPQLRHTLEIVSLQSDRSPYADGFDPTKHMTVYYKLDGRERTDTPASLNKAILAHPERYPPDAKGLIAKAVREKEKSLREQCRPPEMAAVEPEAEGVLDIAPASENATTATPEASADIVEEPPSVQGPIVDLHPAGPAQVSAECEVRLAPQCIAEAESINRFMKLRREHGEEAAVAAKRAEEAPRVEAQTRKKEEEERDDLELLRSGKWWDVVDTAIDEFLAGEPQLRRIIVYSALSAGVRGTRLHLMAIGDSQVGKSYALRSIGSKFFPDLFIDVAAMSAKALYYAADEANNPRLFDGKVLFLDELADQGDGTLDFLKAAMSNGAEKLTSITVDEHRKSKTQALEGLPIIWSTSAEVLEDAEGQIMNRPFVVNPDESVEQTIKILDFQRDAVSVGLLRIVESNIPRARRLLARILEEREIIVYNLFSRHIKISADDARARNTLPMYFNLVAAIAYAHRFARPVIDLPDGRKLLFASWQDNVEAAELWGWASGPKSTGLPNRLIELLNILPFFAGEITGGMELDDIVEVYKSKTGRKAGHKTVLNYLSQLSSKNKASYLVREDEHGKTRHLWYSTGSSHAFPTASQLLIGIESKEGNKLLDEALDSLKSASSQFPNEIRTRIEGLREELLDARSSAQTDL